jgi:hypothetical protein
MKIVVFAILLVFLTNLVKTEPWVINVDTEIPTRVEHIVFYNIVNEPHLEMNCNIFEWGGGYVQYSFVITYVDGTTQIIPREDRGIIFAQFHFGSKRIRDFKIRCDQSFVKCGFKGSFKFNKYIAPTPSPPTPLPSPSLSPSKPQLTLTDPIHAERVRGTTCVSLNPTKQRVGGNVSVFYTLTSSHDSPLYSLRLIFEDETLIQYLRQSGPSSVEFNHSPGKKLVNMELCNEYPDTNRYIDIDGKIEYLEYIGPEETEQNSGSSKQYCSLVLLVFMIVVQLYLQ